MSQKQQKLICIGGLPGSGKTTQGYVLQKIIKNSVLVDPDRHFLQVAGLDPHNDFLKDEHVNSDTVPVVINRMKDQTVQALGVGQTVVVPSSFIGAQMRLDYEQIASDFCVKFVGVWLEADFSERLNRSRQRLKDHQVCEAKGAQRGFNASAISSESHLSANVKGKMNWHRVNANKSSDIVFKSLIKNIGFELKNTESLPSNIIKRKI